MKLNPDNTSLLLQVFLEGAGGELDPFYTGFEMLSASVLPANVGMGSRLLSTFSEAKFRLNPAS